MMKFTRKWDIPNHNTFEIPSIKPFVKYYLERSKISVDPFARNKNWATYTNDLNPETSAEFHLNAIEFLTMIKDKGIQPDLVIFDPPYSLRQLKECYENVGIKFDQKMSQSFHWGEEKRLIDDIADSGTIVLSFGWNSTGMTRKKGYVIEEILLVCHGGAHNDTICLAERKNGKQEKLF